ncbi:hypothetical protein Bbelb_164400 [Branchiostoma belcheri]|nr:hypothetical protein Bbelb_164400 [Branchiostoma belcheri]
MATASLLASVNKGSWRRLFLGEMSLHFDSKIAPRGRQTYIGTLQQIWWKSYGGKGKKRPNNGANPSSGLPSRFRGDKTSDVTTRLAFWESLPGKPDVFKFLRTR